MLCLDLRLYIRLGMESFVYVLCATVRQKLEEVLGKDIGNDYVLAEQETVMGQRCGLWSG